MFRFVFVSAVLCLFQLGTSLEFPEYLSRCREVDLESCGPEAANNAWPVLSRGDQRYGIPSFYPLVLGQTDIISPELTMELNKCELHGLDTLHVYKTEWKEPFSHLGFTVDSLTLIGEFQKGSKIYEGILPRAGVANFTLENVQVEVEILFTTKRNEYNLKQVSPYRVTINIDPETTRYTFSEFRTGIPYYKVENSETLTKLLLPHFERALKYGVQESAGKLTKFFPLDSFFLPKYY